MLISLIPVVTIISEICTTGKDFSSVVRDDTQPAGRVVWLLCFVPFPVLTPYLLHGAESFLRS
jgi:hypothetical protein